MSLRACFVVPRPLGLAMVAAAVAAALSLSRAAPAPAQVVPINFERGVVSGAGFTTAQPTSLAMGPDGRLYVADQEGRIQALTLDPVTKAVLSVEEVASNAELQEVFGIAFDPTDASSPPPVYASNTVSGFGSGGPAAAGTFPGSVTKISGAGYASFTDVVTGLPVSNSGHQTEAIGFRSDGVLFILQGSTTNAGVPMPAGSLFNFEEVPLSGAALVADIHATGFDGNVTYAPSGTYGTNVDQATGDVSVYASGFRNPYDLVFHSNGRIYVTDNGPNAGPPEDPYGPASTSCTTDDGVHALGPDELNILEPGAYYGHPNRNRGRTDPRQCIFHHQTEPDSADHTAPIATLPSSSNGIVEYTSGVFEGQMQGDLLYTAWNLSELHRIELSADGSTVEADTVLATGLPLALDVTVGSDGTIYIAEYGGNKITYLKPDETAATQVTVGSIVPNAGPPSGGQPVTITGTNFTTVADSTVEIGGVPLANLQVINSQTIRGTTPAHALGAADVVVTNSVGTGQLSGGYRYAQSGTPNQLPVARAGDDQQLPIAHIDHSHTVLDGSASLDPDGYITQYEWRESGVVVGTDPVIAVDVEVGTHTFTLTVTDDVGATSTDQIVVAVSSSFTGPPYNCADVDGNGQAGFADFIGLLQSWNAVDGQASYEFFADFDLSKAIGFGDFVQLLSWWNKSCPTVDREIRAMTERILPYRDINVAIADGYYQATGFLTGHTTHWIHQARMDDGVFNLTEPEGLLYYPRPGGQWELWAVFYYIPVWLPGNELPPNGYTGLEDAFHIHDGLCIYPNLSVRENIVEADCVAAGGDWTEHAGWLMHVWNIVANPAGRMTELNPLARPGN